MNVAQEIVARSYVALPEVREPPELIGPLAGVANPEGKSDSGSSTDSSCVPVSWPDAAGSGVMDAVGPAPAPEDTAAEDTAPDAAALPLAGVGLAAVGALADGDGAAADVAELLGEEHPATAASTPATAASAMTDERTPPAAIDDTALPVPDLDSHILTTYLFPAPTRFHVLLSGSARPRAFGIRGGSE